MADALDSVKLLAGEYRRFALEAEVKNEDVRARSHTRRAEALESVAAELEAARKRLRPIPKEFGDLSDLPEEVMSQLALSKVDELEQQLRDIVAAADGREIGLDLIIIELYRRHKVVQERRFVMNKLYRMAQKGLIEGVDGKKGLYYLPKAWVTKSSGGFGDDLDDDIPF